jgi:hypothetical protein
MNRREKNELAANEVMARNLVTIRDPQMLAITVGYLARSYSALARASLRSRNEIITAAAGVPAIVQHPEFIV